MGAFIDQIIPYTTGHIGTATLPIGPFTPQGAGEWLLAVTNTSNGTSFDPPIIHFGGTPGLTGGGVLPTADPFTGSINLAFSTATGVGITFLTDCGATPTLATQITQFESASTTLSLSPNWVNVGDTIILYIVMSSTGASGAVPTWATSTLGNTVSLIYYTADNGGLDAGRAIGVWAGTVVTAGVDSFTLTAGGGDTFGNIFGCALEFTGLISETVIIGAAQHLYEYENIADDERTLISTAADGSGTLSSNNDVDYFDAAGAVTHIFTPSAGAINVRAVDSRDYEYFADGVATDLLKWNIDHGVSKWGIVAPTTPVVVGSATGGGSLTFPLTAAANAVAGNTTYTGTGLDALQPGTSVQIGGFTNAGNDGTFTVVSSTPTTVTVDNPGGVAESATATLTTQNKLRPTTLLNGWGGNAHVGSYEGGVDQGFSFGLDPSTTSAYANPGNAFDGSLTTFASFSGQHTHVYAGVVWSFSGIGASATNVTLNILSEVPTSGTDGQIVTLRSAGIWYSLDAGSTWTQIYDSSVFTKKYSQIAIPNGTTLSNVQVMAFTDAHDDMYHKVYDIYMQATFTGSGPITLQSGRVYFEAFKNSVTGHISDVSPVSASTGAVFGGSIPLLLDCSSPDSQVDREIVLATADGGDETTLYFLADLPIGTCTYLDTTPEEVLLQANTFASVDDNGVEHGIINSDPPPNGQYPTKHQGRLWLIQDNVLFFSKSLGDLTTSTGLIAGKYEEAWDPADQFDISEGAETGVGLYSDGVVLYIATKRHIRRLQGDNPLNFALPQIIFNDVGLNNQEVWQSIYIEGTPAGSMWMTPDFRVIRSDFNTYTNVGEPIQNTLNLINTSAADACWATYVGEADQNFYVLAIPTGTNTIPDTLCIYNIARGSWFVWTSVVNFIAGLYYMNFRGIPRFLVVTPDGGILLFDPAETADNVSPTSSFPIPCTIQTTWLAFGDPQLRKVLNEVEVGTEDPALLVTVEGATTEAQFATPNLVIADAPLTTNFLGDFKTYLAGYTTKDRFYRFTFTSTPTACGGGAAVATLIDYLSMEAIPYHRY